MFSFGHDDRLQFGGVGVMIEPPAIEVTITPSPRFTVRGVLPERIVKFVRTLIEQWQLGAEPACEIDVQAPCNHTGLGVGTQLALAVGAGLQHYLGRPPVSIPELAIMLKRGARSSIGTIGFEHGGLIFDGGHHAGEQLSPFMRQDLSIDWRFVLICRRGHQGLTGDLEASAFASLPPVPESVTAELVRIAYREIALAAAWKDCAAFGDAVYRFGRLAGECFAPAQGGPYASADIEELVEAIRDHGVPGVGQSSWGPTVFAVAADEKQAQSLAQWITERFAAKNYDITIAAPNNTGAQLSTRS
jgi:beta-ribofuranosylaminobenzene 5'-phosphate synthase